MLREKYTNSVATTLNGSINSSVTSVTVTDGSTFPTGAFRVKCENEIMYVTSRSSNVLTVVRGYEGTTAASHADLTPINHTITAQALDRYRLGILADVGLVPYEDSLSADDDEFDDENFSGWTAVAGSPSLTSVIEKSHRVSVILPSGTANAQHYAWMKAKTPGAGDYIQAGFQWFASGNQYPMAFVCMADGATYNSGNQVQLEWGPQESKFLFRHTTGYNAHQSNDSYGDPVHSYPMANLHMRLMWNSSNNYSLFFSIDGVSWCTIATSVSRGSVGTPTHMGFGFTSWGAARPTQFCCNYCRFSF